jgi:hypothetical protein
MHVIRIYTFEFNYESFGHFCCHTLHFKHSIQVHPQKIRRIDLFLESLNTTRIIAKTYACCKSPSSQIYNIHTVHLFSLTIFVLEMVYTERRISRFFVCTMDVELTQSLWV